MNSTRKLAFRPVLKAVDAPASPVIQQHHVQADQISSTSKELWQSLAQATSQKRSPLYKKPPDLDNEKSDPDGVLANGGELASIAKDDSEAGDGSCNTSATLDAVVTEKIKSAMERSLETGAGDAKSSTLEEPAATVSHRWASWHTEDKDSVTTPEEKSIADTVETSVLEEESFVSTGETDLDMSEIVSGEESFYSVTSGNHAAAETAQDDDNDNDAEPADDDSAHVNTAQNGRTFLVPTHTHIHY